MNSDSSFFSALLLCFTILSLSLCSTPFISSVPISIYETNVRHRFSLLEPVYPLPSCGNISPSDISLTVDSTTVSHTLHGFGAALTESSAYNLNLIKTSNFSAYQSLLQSLFVSTAISYIRLPLSSCDYNSPDHTNDIFWTFDDVAGDFNLSHLSSTFTTLASRYTLPIIKDILVVNPNLRIIGTPWSAPFWLKTSQSPTSGSLLPQYVALYAQYLVELLSLYHTYGVTMWGITLQNEPLFEPQAYSGMLMEPPQQIELFQQIQIAMNKKIAEDKIHHQQSKNHPGKKNGDAENNQFDTKQFSSAHERHEEIFRSTTTSSSSPPISLSSFLSSLRLITYDHNWDDPSYPIEVLSDPSMSSLISATAFHCYRGDVVQGQSTVRNAFPEKEIYMTECSGTGMEETNEIFMGNFLWQSENLYLQNILSGGSMTIHWNLILNQNFGPVQGSCTNCRGVVMLMDSVDDLVYSSEFVNLQHFSSLIYEGGQVVNVVNNTEIPSALIYLSVKNPFPFDDSVIQILNSGSSSVNITIEDKVSGNCFRTHLDGQTMQSILYEN